MANNGCFGRFLRCFVFGALVYAVCAGIASVAVAAETTSAPLNDTGVTTFVDESQNNLGTEPGSHPRQDANHGRDALARAGKLTKKGGGSAGFDFTKIANNGTELEPTAALGPAPTDWACTRDNVTGLMWEVKTTSGLRNKDHTYSWYSSDSTTNGGHQGTFSGGTCAPSGRCDTEKFVEDVNKGAGLCGSTNWRMPSANELTGIVDFGQATAPGIDRTYFLNTSTDEGYWSGTVWGFPSYAGVVGHHGRVAASTFSDAMNSAHAVRLVNGAQAIKSTHPDCMASLTVSNPNSDYIDMGDGTVIHTPTGLMWKRCTEGQKWTGDGCERKDGQVYQWADALNIAAKSNFAGKNDWRVPNIKELRSLVQECSQDLRINKTIFSLGSTSFQAFYWSSTPVMVGGDWKIPEPVKSAWIIDFDGGQMLFKARRIQVTEVLVRLVRDVLPSDPVKTCAYTLNPSAAEVESVANNGTLGVTTSLTTCAWTAASKANWITLTSGASGTGGGTVAYSVTANSGTAARRDTISVSGKTAAGTTVTTDFTLTQKAQGSGLIDQPPECTYTLKDKIGVATTSASVGAAASEYNQVHVEVSQNSLKICSWNATSNASWIAINKDYLSGATSGNTFYSVEANHNSTSRTGTLTIAGQTFAVTQAAKNGPVVDPAVASPTPTPTPTPTPAGPLNRPPTPTPGRPPLPIKTSPLQIKATGGLDRFYPGSGLMD